MVRNCLWRFFTIHTCAKVILKTCLDIVNFWSRCDSTVKFYHDSLQNKFVNWKFNNFQAQNLLWQSTCKWWWRYRLVSGEGILSDLVFPQNPSILLNLVLPKIKLFYKIELFCKIVAFRKVQILRIFCIPYVFCKVLSYPMKLPSTNYLKIPISYSLIRHIITKVWAISCFHCLEMMRSSNSTKFASWFEFWYYYQNQRKKLPLESKFHLCPSFPRYRQFYVFIVFTMMMLSNSIRFDSWFEFQ